MQGQGGKGKIGEIFRSDIPLKKEIWTDVCMLQAQPQYIIFMHGSGKFTPTLISYYDGSILTDYAVNMPSSHHLQLRVSGGLLQALQDHSDTTYVHHIRILGAL